MNMKISQSTKNLVDRTKYRARRVIPPLNIC